jgi:hypothetical protein
VKLVIAKRRPEAYWPASRWRFDTRRRVRTNEFLLVTPLFWVRLFEIRRDWKQRTRSLDVGAP